MSNYTLVEKMLSLVSQDKINNISYMDRYLAKYTKTLFDGSFFEEIILYDFDAPNLTYHYFISNNKKQGVQGLPYFEAFSSFKKNIDYSKQYFFEQNGLDYPTFYQCYNFLNAEIENDQIANADAVFDSNKCTKVSADYIHIPVYLDCREGSQFHFFSFRIKNILEVTKDIRIEYPVMFSLIIATMFDSNILPHASQEYLFLKKPRYTGDMMIANIILKISQLPDLNIILKLSSAKYEGTNNFGVIDFYIENKSVFTKENIDSINVEFDNLLSSEAEIVFKDRCEISEENIRELRKYVELSSENVSLMAWKKYELLYDYLKPIHIPLPWKVYGLRKKVSSSGRYARLSFLDYLKWKIEYSNNEEIVYDGVSFAFRQTESMKNEVDDQIRFCQFVSPEKEGKIINIVSLAQKQLHGTMLVFVENAQEEAERLGSCGRAIRIHERDFSTLLSEYIYKITSIDGAIILDLEGNAYAMGAILDGQAIENSNRGRGARYNSGYTYVKNRDRPCFCVIVSEDKTTDVISNSDMFSLGKNTEGE